MTRPLSQIVVLTGWPLMIQRPLEDAAEELGLSVVLLNPFKQSFREAAQQPGTYLLIDSRALMKTAFRDAHDAWLRQQRFSVLGWSFDVFDFPQYQIDHCFRESRLMPRVTLDRSEISCGTPVLDGRRYHASANRPTGRAVYAPPMLSYKKYTEVSPTFAVDNERILGLLLEQFETVVLCSKFSDALRTSHYYDPVPERFVDRVWFTGADGKGSGAFPSNVQRQVAQADLLVTFASTAGIEALAWGRPVLVLEDAAYTGFREALYAFVMRQLGMDQFGNSLWDRPYARLYEQAIACSLPVAMLDCDSLAPDLLADSLAELKETAHRLGGQDAWDERLGWDPGRSLTSRILGRIVEEGLGQ